MKKYFFQPRLFRKPGKIIRKPNLRPSRRTEPSFRCSKGFNLSYILPVSGKTQIGNRSYRIINHLNNNAGMRIIASQAQGVARMILIIGGAP